MKPRDPIWKYYFVVEEGTKIKNAICKVCNTVVSAKVLRLKSHRVKCLGLYKTTERVLEEAKSAILTDVSQLRAQDVQTQLEYLNRNLNTYGPQKGTLFSTDTSEVCGVKSSLSPSSTQSSGTVNKDGGSDGNQSTTRSGDGALCRTADSAGCKTFDGVVCKTEPVDTEDAAAAVSMGPHSSEQPNKSRRVQFTSGTLDKESNAPEKSTHHEPQRLRNHVQTGFTSLISESPLTEMSPLSPGGIAPFSHGTESIEAINCSSFPYTNDAAQKKRKITQDDILKMQYEVLVEQKKKMVEETIYYQLKNKKLRKELEHDD